MSEGTEPLRWLHLSDFHTGHDKVGQRRLFKDLLEHMRNHIEEEEAYPDIVFITGDIADKGRADEYKLFFDEFFFEMAALLNSELSANIFLIPGNHDVQRDEMDKLWLPKFFTEFPTALDPDIEGKKRRSRLLERFWNYIEAKEIHDCTPIKEEWLRSDAGAYVHILPIKDDEKKKVGILGLNTAWLSWGDSDQHNLAVGKEIVASGLDMIDSCAIKIVLGHHQLDWLHPKELEPIRARFAKSGVLYMHGDQHKNRIRLEDARGQQFLTIESGAAFQGRDDDVWSNRLLWCNLYPDEQVIRFHPRIWSSTNQEWGLDSSLPERKRIKGTDYWEYRLPNASRQIDLANESRTSRRTHWEQSRTQLEGWRLLDQRYLAERKEILDKEDAMAYFDGGDATWEVALSSKVPRRGIVEEICRVVGTTRRSAPTVTVLLGGGGEGKSTILRQVATDLLEEHNTWKILWQEKAGIPFPKEFWGHTFFAEGDWLVVVDEADLIIQSVYDAVKDLPAKRREHFHFLLCCRDTDWRSARADTLAWNKDSFVKVPREPLAGITEADAAIVIRAWKDCQADGSGLGKLQGIAESEAIQKFVALASSEVAKKSGNGAFLGAMLQVRFGGNLQNHVLDLLNSLSRKNLYKPHEEKTLLDAFAYIAALHAEDISILTEEILAKCLDIDLERETGYIHRHVVSLLGKEVGTTLSRDGDFGRVSPTLLTRHKMIAETAIKVLRDNFYFEDGVWRNMFKKLVKSAVTIYDARIAYVPKLAIWRQLPADIAHNRKWKMLFEEEKARKDFAIELAELLVQIDLADPLYVTQLAELYTEAEMHDMAVTTFRKGAKYIPEARRDKIYYHDWAKSEGRASHVAMSVWLDSIALADHSLYPKRRDNYTNDGYAMMFLHGLAINFKEMISLYPEKQNELQDAWVAAVQLGLRLRGNFMTAETRKNLELIQSTIRAQGIHRLEPASALRDLEKGIIAVWELREDTTLSTLRAGKELTFAQLSSLLGI